MLGERLGARDDGPAPAPAPALALALAAAAAGEPAGDVDAAIATQRPKRLVVYTRLGGGPQENTPATIHNSGKQLLEFLIRLAFHFWSRDFFCRAIAQQRRHERRRKQGRAVQTKGSSLSKCA